MQLAVIDIGGTAIKYGLWNETSGVFQVESVATEAHQGAEHILARIVHCLQSLQPFDGIAVSTAGTVDAETGIILYATDAIPGYSGFEVKSYLEERFHLPVAVENDVHCAALSVREEIQDALIITLGTGIGGSLLQNGEVYKGSNSLAGAIGHMTLYPNGELCKCGRMGCYEQYASVSSLSRRIWEANGKPLPVPLFFEKMPTTKLFQEVFQNWIYDVATGLASAIHLLGVDKVYVGGGITAQQDVIFFPLQQALKERLLEPFQEKVRIERIEFGNDANLYGAAQHFINQN